MNIITRFLLSFLSTAAFSLPMQQLDTAEIAARLVTSSFIEKLSAVAAVFGAGMFPIDLLISALLYLFYRQYLPKRSEFSVSALVLGSLFSLSMIVGESVSVFGDLYPLFSNLPQAMMTGMKFAGYSVFFYTAVRAAFSAMDHSSKRKSRKDAWNVFIWEKHPFAFAFFVILLFWLPYAVAFYPGFVPSDGLKQLNNFFGIGHFSDNHPAFSTMLMGWAMKAGRNLGSDNLGIFIFCGTQLLITAGCLAACFPVFRLLNTPFSLRRGSLFYFAFLPFWPNYGYSLLKDTLYMDMLLLYALFMIRILRDKNFFTKNKTLRVCGLTAALWLMVMVRHEGKYIVLASFPFLFLRKECRIHWRPLLAAFLIPLSFVTIFNYMIRPALKIADAPAREAMTLPFRQTAKVILDQGEALDAETTEIFKGFFENYDTIPVMYSVSNGDYMKGLFDPYADRAKVLAFYSAWAKLGMRFPLTYLDVFLCCASNYFYPLTAPYREIYGWFGIEQESYVNQGFFDISYMKRFEGTRNVLTNWADALPKLPISGLFYSLGISAWGICFCLGYLSRKTIRGNLVPLLPAAFTLILCLNTAINGFFRYMLPVLICLPLGIAWCFSEAKRASVEADEAENTL